MSIMDMFQDFSIFLLAIGLGYHIESIRKREEEIKFLHHQLSKVRELVDHLYQKANEADGR